MPINLIIMEGTRPPTGASPTQPYKCGQYFKIKVKINVVVDVDFNILTAFIRLGRAGPRRGPGALHNYKIYRHCAPP